ncbi:MAG: diguanylate cyclase [Dehalococcoidia bacterium]
MVKPTTLTDRILRSQVLSFAVNAARSTEHRQPFFSALAGQLALGLGIRCVVVGELGGEPSRFRSLASWVDGAPGSESVFDLAQTPLAKVARGSVISLDHRTGAGLLEGGYPNNWPYENLLALPASDSRGKAVGILLLADTDPLPSLDDLENELATVASRIGIEIEAQRNLRRLLDSEAVFRDLYENAPLAYFTVDSSGLIRGCNRRARGLLGIDESGLRGRHVIDLYADSVFGKTRAYELLRRFQAGLTIDNEELEMKREDGTSVWVSLTVEPIKDDHGDVIASRSAVVDVTARRALEERLREQSLRDSLTGALNHAAIVEALESKINDEAKPELNVIMVDLDNFKAINDRFGHITGDVLLGKVSDALSRSGSLVGRYGGDEFLVILPGSLKHATSYLETVAGNLACLDVGASEPVCIRASFGISHYPRDASSGMELIRMADADMYLSRGIRVQAFQFEPAVSDSKVPGEARETQDAT